MRRAEALSAFEPATTTDADLKKRLKALGLPYASVLMRPADGRPVDAQVLRGKMIQVLATARALEAPSSAFNAAANAKAVAHIYRGFTADIAAGIAAGYSGPDAYERSRRKLEELGGKLMPGGPAFREIEAIEPSARARASGGHRRHGKSGRR